MKPIVMPADRVKLGIELNKKFPGRIGNIFSYEHWVYPRGVPFVLDNGRFAVWDKGKKWSRKGYLKFLDKAVPCGPSWIAVPDFVGDSKRTFDEWYKWHSQLQFGIPLALVVQDGMTVEQVKNLSPKPEVIFVGGTTEFKWRTLTKWTKNFPRVHVGRANTIRLLWMVHRSGAESSDGTGWWHRRQMKQLIKYLEMTEKGLQEHRASFGL